MNITPGKNNINTAINKVKTKPPPKKKSLYVKNMNTDLAKLSLHKYLTTIYANN